ncbi:hypothetical protein [Lacticaseibacillus absianus]|uniref:hypothetical protein n=1 Tax=Lacticaseibacillus absianus TaxID=2729623 RepID=UPI0015CB27EF|nr:hypothetical protein [Lacticaseibacillus absianus]
MKHIKRVGALGLVLTSALVLAGCGKTLTTTKTTYQQSGMVAVIKGEAKGASRVHYRAATGDGSVKVNSGAYVITVPVTTKAQSVRLMAGDLDHRVTVKAAQSLGAYKTVAAKYNQAIIATALPKDVQKQLKQAGKTKVDASQLTPAQQAAMVKQQQALQAAMAKASAATKAKQLPATFSGLKQALKTSGGTVRLNVQGGQLMGITDMVPVKALKDKQAQAAFGTQFGLLANAVGADAQKVAKAFQKATSDKDSSSTTIDTITSHGVKFDVGFSATTLFIYITK